MSKRVPGGQDYRIPQAPGGPGEQALADVDAVFSALAHPTRRHILLVLQFRGGEMTAGDIAGRFDCAWPTITRHLSKLKDAGLVTVEPEGRERLYRLDAARLRAVTSGWLKWFGD